MPEDRKVAIDKIVNEIEKSDASKKKFLKDPAGFAKTHGVNLTNDEALAIKFLNKSNIDSSLRKLIRNVGDSGFFDNNCGCGTGGGGGTLGW